MVDFKKLLNNRKHHLPAKPTTTRCSSDRPNYAAGEARSCPVLETALHRELSDPDYLDQLLEYADERLAS